MVAFLHNRKKINSNAFTGNVENAKGIGENLTLDASSHGWKWRKPLVYHLRFAASSLPHLFFACYHSLQL
nr:hypothetical protein Iba_chr11bCG9650 [Ipomoea batatas]